ncbi:MAG: ABC transporter permease, partial [Gemmatimonadetes bacterium]|nr:ABC transporter permease [Gemmatimonadota bacterium]
MKPEPSWRRYLRFWGPDVDADVEDELQFHLATRAEELEARGVPTREARARALAEFGDLAGARRECREIGSRQLRRGRRGEWLDSLRQDLRFALRSLAKSPGFTAVGLLTLALGIGANTAIFSVVDGVLLRPPPVADPDRLVMLWETDRNSGTSREPASVPDYLDFRRKGAPFAALAAFTGQELNFTPDDGEPVRLAALAASHELQPMVGIRPLFGRSFTAAEDRPGGPHVAMISEGVWRRVFAGAPDVLGRSIRLDGVPHTVVGVLPASADFGTLQVLSAADYGRAFAERGERVRVDVWVPLQPDPKSTPRDTHPIFVLGRLAPGATPASAQQEMGSFAAALEAAYPENAGRGVHVEPFQEVVLGPVRPALLVLFGAVGLVLLIACANVMNLLLARGAARRHEIAVRAAMGAGRGRLARQFVVESLVLTLAAAGLGVLVARLGLGSLLALAPSDIARLDTVEVDGRVLAATLAISLLVGVGFGTVPVFQAWRVDLLPTLRGEAGRGASAGRERRRFRGALVSGEMALAVVLLVGAGLLIKSFRELLRVDPGFRTERVLKAEYELPSDRYPADFATWPRWKEIRRFDDELLRRAAALPGVEAAALAGAHPLNAGFTNSFQVVGREAEARGWPEIGTRQVTPGYFRAMGVPLLRGRALRASDDAAAPRAVVINQAAARRFFAGREPLGEQVVLWGQRWTIVGVVGNERFHGLAASAPPAVYQSLLQAPMSGGVLLLRTRGDPRALAPAVRAAIREIDPALAAFGVEPLDRTLARTLGQRRFTTLLLGAFAAVALLLAVVGVHGILHYEVAQQTREIGIRMALGAEPGRVLRWVMEQGLVLAAVGAGVGILGALGLTRVLSSLLYGVSPTDPAIFAAVVGVLVAVALLASWLPARRA